MCWRREIKCHGRPWDPWHGWSTVQHSNLPLGNSFRNWLCQYVASLIWQWKARAQKEGSFECRWYPVQILIQTDSNPSEYWLLTAHESLFCQRLAFGWIAAAFLKLVLLLSFSHFPHRSQWPLSTNLQGDKFVSLVLRQDQLHGAMCASE